MSYFCLISQVYMLQLFFKFPLLWEYKFARSKAFSGVTPLEAKIKTARYYVIIIIYLKYFAKHKYTANSPIKSCCACKDILTKFNRNKLF